MLSDVLPKRNYTKGIMEYINIIKKLLNILTAEEKETFDRWYEESEKHRDRFRREEEFLYSKGYPQVDKTANWKRLTVEMDHLKQRNSIVDTSIKRKRYWSYGAAACIALSVAVGAYFYGGLDKEIIPEETVIEMGGSKAILTLDDGTEVALKEGEAYTSDYMSSNGEAVVYTPEKKGNNPIVYNYLTIPRGGEFLLQLADSTKIWLNSDSKIRYPNTFVKGQPRVVELLYGEAYFEVSSASKHQGSSFKVKTRNQEIEVLGTEFNVSAYKEDDQIVSTLVKGEVVVSNGSITKELTPGKQAIVVDSTREIEVKEVEVYNYMAWKEGYFGYEDKPLKEIMQMLSRWYDVEVKIENKELENIRFGGVLSRRVPIEDLLPMFSGDITYEIIGKQVIIK
ncbi:FecR family protein [Sinomicrobium sp.]